MSIEEARRKVASDFACKIEKAAEDRVREIVRDEIAKLSPAPVGENRRKFVGDIIAGIKPEVDRLMGKAPTPPAKDTEGEAYSYAVSLFLHLAPQCEPLPDLIGVLTQIDNATTVIPDMRKQIAALEAQLAEAGDALTTANDIVAGLAIKLSDAKKRIEALEAERDNAISPLSTPPFITD